MMAPEILIDTAGAVGRLILDRPQRLNALSDGMLRGLIAAAEELTASDVRTVLVSGRGRAFCAGYDRDGFRALGDAGGGREEAAALGGRMADAIAGMRPVTIAVLHGHVVGGGVVLALACDLRLAAADTVFSIPEVDLGIPLGWGGLPRLVTEVGPARARELVMTGRTFTAGEAERIGIVNRVVPADGLADAAETLAAQIAAKPMLPIATTKRHVAELTAASVDDVAGLLAALEDDEASKVRRRALDGS